MKMKDIVIIGAGGFGREVAWLIEDINKISNEWSIEGFVDDNKDIQGTLVNGYKVVGNMEWLATKDYYVINAIGEPRLKERIANLLSTSNCKFATLVHPSVIVSPDIIVGEGSIICAGSIVTVNVEIGKHVIINLDCTVGHDAIIEDYSTVLPSVNVSGHVTINKRVSVGTGTSIIQGLDIGRDTVIGAGSVVVRNLPSNCTAVGSPAKPIKFHNDDF